MKQITSALSFLAAITIVSCAVAVTLPVAILGVCLGFFCGIFRAAFDKGFRDSINLITCGGKVKFPFIDRDVMSRPE